MCASDNRPDRHTGQDTVRRCPAQDRSGKIMRRILTKIAAGDVEHLGDTSTLADPSVVETLVKERL